MAEPAQEILGYPSVWSVTPGGTVAFHVSCASSYHAEIVRITRGGPRTDGTPDVLDCLPVGADLDGEYAGRVQPTRPGSAMTAPIAVTTAAALTLQCWVYPTLSTGQDQGVVALPGGPALLLDATGAATVRCGDLVVSTGAPLLLHHWHLLTASVDRSSGTVAVVCRRLRTYAGVDDVARATAEGATGPAWQIKGDLLVGRLGVDTSGRAVGSFNGKLEAPRLWAGAAAVDEFDSLSGDPASAGGLTLIGSWDLGRDPDSARVVDASGHEAHGRLVNAPLRAVTGHLWDGTAMSPAEEPSHYAAAHFHDDDLADCGWEVDFSWQVPADTPSGVYAARLRSGTAERHVLFFVLPAPGRPTSDTVLLVPTYTYLAYSNYRLDLNRAVELTGRPVGELHEVDAILTERGDLGLSLYNRHRDGSGTAHVSRLRPVLSMEPSYPWSLSGGGGWCLSADLYLVDWLTVAGIDVDVVTDEDLHREGADLLNGYSTVLTGSHPEYVTEQMLDALSGYLDDGGSLMYLGGNGFYWVTTVLSDRPDVIELRRGLAGTRAWSSEPGEEHHTNGERGGLWRHRGRAPQRLVGVGFTAQGGDSASYRFEPDAQDPRVGFVVAGVDIEAPLGDYGQNMSGAAGAEIDRTDVSLGTPPGTFVLATSRGRHSDMMQRAIEEVPAMKPGQGGSESAEVRSDVVYFETAAGGGVFSTGSVNWIASLSHQDYDNGVARITRNVLDDFRQRAAGEAL
ncbi:N,N-dimethylformamidase beta subunit family domain-containing protein [Actinomadura sp. NPDC048032]|uniref:N,N-dimethylformamidase beta subunit family domain-containing protein n=1 Tax=Actinomadura sp. NPDC048032 TaxID=3155747 RepID=UPI0033D3544B